MCRCVEDCAVIFDIIRGRDDLDPTSTDATLIDPFEVDLTKLTVGYLPGVNTATPEVSRAPGPLPWHCPSAVAIRP